MHHAELLFHNTEFISLSTNDDLDNTGDPAKISHLHASLFTVEYVIRKFVEVL